MINYVLCIYNISSDIISITTRISECKKYFQTSILENHIWFNGENNIDHKVLFYKLWYEKGELFIYNILKTDKSMNSFEEFRSKYNIQTNFL